MYFSEEGDNVCIELSDHIQAAKIDGLKEIELIEAIPDNSIKDHVWCMELENTVERSDCSKCNCHMWTSSNGRVCDFRGKLYKPAQKVKFDVETGKKMMILSS